MGTVRLVAGAKPAKVGDEDEDGRHTVIGDTLEEFGMKPCDAMLEHGADRTPSQEFWCVLLEPSSDGPRQTSPRV